MFPNYKSKGNTYYSIRDIPLKETRELSLREKKKINNYRINFIAKETGKDLSKIFTLSLIKEFLIITFVPIEQFFPIKTSCSIILLCPIEQFEPIETFEPIKTFFP